MKKLTILLFFTFLSFSVISQTTAIPDANFEQALINLGYDSGPIDGLVLTANIDTIDSLNVSFSFISNMTGIEDFTALFFLDCSNNQLTGLNVTQNNNLAYLSCWQNQLISLDVSQNNGLIDLYCFINQLSSLNVTQNNLLNKLICWQNQLTTLDVSQNPSLTVLECFTNQLSSINVSQNSLLTTLTCNNNLLSTLNVKNGNNLNFTLLGATNNPSLTCIQVDDSAWSANNWTNIDTQSYFSENCSVGLKENSNNPNVFIYPNPAKNFITIDIANKRTNTSYNLKIIDLAGKLVYSTTLYNYLNKINTAFLPKGYYTMSLSNINGTVIVKKLIISP